MTRRATASAGYPRALTTAALLALGLGTLLFVACGFDGFATAVPADGPDASSLDASTVDAPAADARDEAAEDAQNAECTDGGTSTCGVGACARTIDACVGGKPQICIPGVPEAETCNGDDDDCNGVIDDGFAPLACGVGACARSVASCQNGVVVTACVPGAPSAEICDTFDNDCDGVIDEDPPLAAAFTPISMTGFNVDAIAESDPASAATTGVVDGSDYVLYSVAYAGMRGVGAGLPDNGTLVKGVRTYQLNAFNQANVLKLTANQTASLTLTTPAAYASLSVLGFATEGAGNAKVTLEYSDGTTQVFTDRPLADWFSVGGASFNAFGRTGRTSNAPDPVSVAPAMHAFDLNVPCGSRAKLLQKVTVQNLSANATTRLCVLAIAGGP